MPAEDLPVAEFAFPGPLRDKLVAAILAAPRPPRAAWSRGTRRNTSHCRDPVSARSWWTPPPPVAVIETTGVRVVRLGDVDTDHALGEGEGFTSVAEWRADHERFWHSAEIREELGDPDFTVDDDTLVVAQTFRLVEP